MFMVGSGMHKIIHDASFAETVELGRYVVVKVFDEKEEQVGQVKLEVAPHKDGSDPILVNIKVSGNIAIQEHKDVAAQSVGDFDSLVWEHDHEAS